MNLRFYIISLLLFSCCLELYSNNSYANNCNVKTDTINVSSFSSSDIAADTIIKYVVVHDTVYLSATKKPKNEEMLLKVKPVGRYDRGISNYRIIRKGKWIGGLTLSFYNFEADDSRLLFSLLKDLDINLNYKSVSPFVGYTLSDNNVLGLKFGYSRISAAVNNLSLNAMDMDIALSDVKYSDDSYSVKLFHRSYIGLDSNGIFGLFNETTLGYASGSSRFSTGKEDSYKYTDTSLSKLQLGINPGVAVFIMPNVGAEISFGVAGFSYNWETQKKSNGETGKRTSSGANFKINLFNINIGLIICI